MKKTFCHVAMFGCVVMIFAGCNPQDPAVPMAKMTVSGGNCTVPCTVNFTDVSTNTSVYEWNYQWEFGDGEKSTSRNPVHKYQKAGNYKVKFTLSGKYGTSSDTATVVIKGVPADPPTANFTTAGGNCEAPCEVIFTNTSLKATTYLWNFGDKSMDSVSTAEHPKHTFTKAGTYNVKLTATGAGGTNSKTETVVIKPAVPLSVSFTMTQELVADVDSVAVTFKNTSTGAVKYEWDFGDGKAKSAATDPVHRYKNLDATFTITLKASDKANASQTKTETLTITKK